MRLSGKIEEGLSRLTKGKKVIAITCLQWGDTGKGKFVDLLASWAKYIVRGTGGDNAGHSIHANGQEHVFHIVPSGILYDAEGKINVIGSGTVVNPGTLIHELWLLENAGLSYENLRLSLSAKLILPTQIVADRIKEASFSKGRIGTTGRGIGPAYADFYARQGLMVNDLLNKDVFVAKLRRHLEAKRRELSFYDHHIIREVMAHESLGSGVYYSPQDIFDEESIVYNYLEYGKKLRELIVDTDFLVQSAVNGIESVLLEGAQGVLLSVDHGSYPYVTSSDCSVVGLAKGAGLNPGQVDLSLGIVKGFYMTRVGEGPFPTELGGEESARWCAVKKRSDEDEQYSDVSVNDVDEFRQGIALRRVGKEYGATTGRPRRTGWLDLPLLRHAIGFDPSLIMTKLDVLNDCDTISVCESYEYAGPDIYYGDRFLTTGKTIDKAIVDTEVLKHCLPIYRDFPGWKCDLSGINSREGLPKELLDILKYVEDQVGGETVAISTGPDREETIIDPCSIDS
jgi:adenylosuccinate synthase